MIDLEAIETWVNTRAPVPGVRKVEDVLITDAAFISRAREVIPALIAEVRKLKTILQPLLALAAECGALT